MYVCVRVYVYVCMPVCVYACTRVCMYACLCVCVSVSLDVCMCVYMSRCLPPCSRTKLRAPMFTNHRSRRDVRPFVNRIAILNSKSSTDLPHRGVAERRALAGGSRGELRGHHLDRDRASAKPGSTCSGARARRRVLHARTPLN